MNWLQIKIIQWRNAPIRRKQKKFHADILRGKAVLEMIDNHLMQTHQTRKQRRKFWDEFFKSQNVRSHVYSIIEKALEGETKYKKRPGQG